MGHNGNNKRVAQEFHEPVQSFRVLCLTCLKADEAIVIDDNDGFMTLYCSCGAEQKMVIANNDKAGI